MVDSGLDTGPSRKRPTVESLERARPPLGLQLAVRCFSLPALIGYLFPLHLAYTVQIVLTLVIAGTGAYALARVLGLGVLGLRDRRNGLRAQWLLHGMARVAPCGRDVLGGLAVRRRHPYRPWSASGPPRGGFALLIALAVYSGEPEIFVILCVSVVVFVSTMLIVR